MKNPYLSPHYHPRVKIKVLLNQGVEADCLIDTGFSGGISLPQSYSKKLKEKPLGFQEYELADGSRVTFPIYEIEINYQKHAKTISLIFTNSEDVLVGIEFLRGLRFVLDLKKSQVYLG